MLIFWLIASICNFIAVRESPPKSKKLSKTPMSSVFNIFLNISNNFFSSLVVGLSFKIVLLLFSKLVGNWFLSTLPF